MPLQVILEYSRRVITLILLLLVAHDAVLKVTETATEHDRGEYTMQQEALHSLPPDETVEEWLREDQFFPGHNFFIMIVSSEVPSLLAGFPAMPLRVRRFVAQAILSGRKR